jgi:hypothetical protein
MGGLEENKLKKLKGDRLMFPSLFIVAANKWGVVPPRAAKNFVLRYD